MENVLELLFSFFIGFLSIFSSSYDINLDNEYSDNFFIEDNSKNLNFPILNQIENSTSNLEVIFCPYENCELYLSNLIRNTNNEIKCAFYELNHPKVVDSFKFLLDKNVSIEIIVDDIYLERNNFKELKNFEKISIYSDVDRGTKYNNFMHNKFCVIDNEIILTGSTNPTENCLDKNNNNLIKFNSKYLAKNYLNEFNQMKNGFFGTNKKSLLEYNNISLNFENESYIINTYFCPQDNCLSAVLEILENAQNEILFASFAFTNDDIATTLKMKNFQGINVSGVIETRSQNLKGSDYKIMKEDFYVALDKNKNTMHHKYFIIDEKIVISGSMNPTGSGVDYNDENLIIVENDKIAKLFKKDFLGLIS